MVTIFRKERALRDGLVAAVSTIVSGARCCPAALYNVSCGKTPVIWLALGRCSTSECTPLGCMASSPRGRGTLASRPSWRSWGAGIIHATMG
jgi:hypothetical protein